MSPTHIGALSEEDFDEVVLASKLPYLVDFWAEWCAPCVALATALGELAADTAEQIHIGSVDIVEQPALSERFGVMSVPTMLLFQDGEIVKRMYGAKTPRALRVELEDYL